MSSEGEAAARRSGELFSPRTLLAIIAIGTAAFVGMIYLAMFGGGDPEFEIGPSAYSSSALGHKALTETLRRIDVPVVISRFRTAEKAGQGSLLVLAEPDDSETSKELLANFQDAPHGLLVLPKWDGSRDVARPRWVGSMGMVQEETVETVLESAQVDALVKRFNGTFTLDVPSLGGEIELTTPQVIIDSQGLTPVVSFKGGILIGETADSSGRHWVLSDPDIIANHGIDQGDNAVVAVSIIEALRPAGGVVIFDETIHGLELRPNLMRTAFELPFSIVTLSAAAAIALAIWAGLMRFGRPDPAQRALQPGKITLIRTTADLLRQGNRKGTVELVLTRYLKAQVADLVARLNGPRGLSENRQIAWLDDLAVARRLGARLQPLAATIEATAKSHSTDPGRALRLAADLHAWKQEFLYGLAKGSSDR
jgi:hypothetical protein